MTGMLKSANGMSQRHERKIKFLIRFDEFQAHKETYKGNYYGVSLTESLLLWGMAHRKI